MPIAPINIPTLQSEHAPEPKDDRHVRFDSNPAQLTPQNLRSPLAANVQPQKSALKRHPTDPAEPIIGNPGAIRRVFTDPAQPMESPMRAATAQGNKMQDFCLNALREDSGSTSALLLNKLASTPSRNPRRMSSDEAKTLEQIRQDLVAGKPTDFQQLKENLKGKGAQQDKA